MIISLNNRRVKFSLGGGVGRLFIGTDRQMPSYLLTMLDILISNACSLWLCEIVPGLSLFFS